MESSDGEALNLRSIVLDTPELMELVLLNLPMVDILTAQLVCQDWKRLVEYSCCIQQYLYLRPRNLPQRRDGVEIGYFECGGATLPQQRMVAITTMRAHLDAAPTMILYQSISAREAMINPILTELFRNSVIPQSVFASRHGYLQASRGPILSSSYRRVHWLHCPPIWRQMYALQPPSPAMSIGTCRGWWGWEFDDLRDPAGVTIGQLLDWLGAHGSKLNKGFLIMSCPPPDAIGLERHWSVSK